MKNATHQTLKQNRQVQLTGVGNSTRRKLIVKNHTLNMHAQLSRELINV